MELSSDEIRVINSAIVWRTCLVPTLEEAGLTDDQSQWLRILGNELGYQAHVLRVNQGGSLRLHPLAEKYWCQDGEMKLPPDQYHLLVDSLARFQQEYLHSPIDIYAQSGLPAEVTDSTLAKLLAARQPE